MRVRLAPGAPVKVKAGVTLNGMHFLLFYAAALYDYLRQANGLGEGTITGGLENADKVGAARVRGTLHPWGKAVDLRISDMPAAVWSDLARVLQQQLGPAFQVILEEDHIHVEYIGPDLVRI